MRVFRERLSICACVRACVCVCASFPFGFEGDMWDLIVLIPDHCLSIYSSDGSSQEYILYKVIINTVELQWLEH